MDNFDFSGWATRNDLKCSDGRTIRKDAFKHNDGQKVPLVWNHQHNEAFNVLGHALLENRNEGVYAYCTFNDSESGRNAKELVEHGDITALSIYANHLKQDGGNVLHGDIREVSLVLAGANPGALIENVITHGDTSEDEAVIFTGEEISLAHEDYDEDVLSTLTEDQRNAVNFLISQALKNEGGDTASHADGDETIADVWNTLSEKQKNVIYFIIANLTGNEDGEMSQSDENGETMSHADGEETIADVWNTLSEKQKNVIYFIIAKLTEDGEMSQSDTNNGENNQNEESEGGENTMNVFEQNGQQQNNTLSHADMETILNDAKRLGSLKEAFLAHAEGDIEYSPNTATYGIDGADWLFPEATNLNPTPGFIQRNMDWVQKVMRGVHHSPFSRIKSVFADITEDEARAKGYIKGKLKKNEVFTLLKRTTTPTTIYKKQKMDRDDLIDITDFDVVAWLKGEMRMMLDEELARAFLVGDGRLSSSDDKINELNIRPIWTDDDLFTIKKLVEVDLSTASESDIAKEFIRSVIKSRKDYKGSGNPVLFTTEDFLTDCLLLEDTTGRVIYDSVSKLASVLRVSDIVTVPVMEGLTRTTSEGKTRNLLGIIVNLADYNVGADKGGAINMFEDFDIDYNQQKYLIETRCSGALTKPYSAITLETENA